MNKKSLGLWGEQQAWAYLSALNYRCLARNWKAAYPYRGELDLVCCSPEACLVFVEVKTLAHGRFGWPEQQLKAKQEAQIWRMACHWVELHRYQGPLRFDLISIIAQPFDLRHFQDVFFPVA